MITVTHPGEKEDTNKKQKTENEEKIENYI